MVPPFVAMSTDSLADMTRKKAFSIYHLGASHLIPRGGPGFFLEKKQNFEFYKKKKKLWHVKKKKNIHNHLQKLYSMSKFTHFLSILLARLVIL